MNNLFYSNDFDTLVKENKLRSVYLSDEDKSILKKLVSRLSASKLSAFDIQTSRKDFIGMALQAEQRGENLNSVIGDDMNSFCEEIIKSGRKKGWKEAAILPMPWILLNLTIYYGVIYILWNSCPVIMKINLRDSIYFLLWCLIGIPLGSYLSGKTEFESKMKKSLPFWIVLGIPLSLKVLDSSFSLKQVVLFEVIGWVPLAVMAILLMLSYFLRNKYLSNLSKKYNWSDN
jgi:DNA-binding ferritin-like protein (Dps family)